MELKELSSQTFFSTRRLNILPTAFRMDGLNCFLCLFGIYDFLWALYRLFKWLKTTMGVTLINGNFQWWLLKLQKSSPLKSIIFLNTKTEKSITKTLIIIFSIFLVLQLLPLQKAKLKRHLSCPVGRQAPRSSGHLGETPTEYTGNNLPEQKALPSKMAEMRNHFQQLMKMRP